MCVQFLLLNIRGEVSKGQSKASIFALLEGTSTVKNTLGIGKKFTLNFWEGRQGRIFARES